MTFNISYCGTLTEHRGFMISAQMAVHYIFAPPLLRRNRFSGPPDAYNTGAEGGRRGLRWDLPEYFTWRWNGWWVLSGKLCTGNFTFFRLYMIRYDACWERKIFFCESPPSESQSPSLFLFLRSLDCVNRTDAGSNEPAGSARISGVIHRHGSWGQANVKSYRKFWLKVKGKCSNLVELL